MEKASKLTQFIRDVLAGLRWASPTERQPRRKVSAPGDGSAHKVWGIERAEHPQHQDGPLRLLGSTPGDGASLRRTFPHRQATDIYPRLVESAPDLPDGSDVEAHLLYFKPRLSEADMLMLQGFDQRERAKLRLLRDQMHRGWPLQDDPDEEDERGDGRDYGDEQPAKGRA